jgi:phosphoglycerate dehydrogenase-like enzyme
VSFCAGATLRFELPGEGMRQPPVAGPLVLGLLYPTVWIGDEKVVAGTVDAIEAIDPRIELVLEPYDEGQALRTARGRPENWPAARRSAPGLTEAQLALFERVHAIITVDLPFDVGAIAPNLSWVQGLGAGYAQLESAGLAEAGIRLSSAAGVNAIAIAEFVVGRVLQERKRFREIEASQAQHSWEPVYGTELAGSTIGLIGYGAIASATARRLAAFDVTLLATRRSARPGDSAPHINDLYPADRLHDMIARCDTVIAAVPETPETIGLMDADAFAAMPAGSFFVNVGRGTLVDEPALIDALRRHHLRGAALDVASEEPLPPDHPLWDAPNLYLSYHCSSAPAALFVNLNRLWADNIRRWLAGERLLNEIDLEPDARSSSASA